MMLQNEKPEDFVIATGRTESVRRFLNLLLKIRLGFKNNSRIIWENEGINEIGKRADTGQIVIKIDPRYYRPTEVDELLGDASKAEKKLGWKPKISLEEMISEMVDNEMNFV